MDDVVVDGGTPGVSEVFGAAYPAVLQFAELLADHGVARGLIGPREVPRLWDRHLLNSASIAPYLPAEGVVVDVGSGAGLPGVVVACLRPDLHTVLLEPMERRAAWLREVIEVLGLTSAEVVRGRAEDVDLRGRVTAVTARAVAPLDRLAQWTLPLLGVGGVLLAMKGNRAAEEVEAARGQISQLGGGTPEVLTATSIPEVVPTTIVRVTKERDLVAPAPARPRRGRRSGKARP